MPGYHVFGVLSEGTSATVDTKCYNLPQKMQYVQLKVSAEDLSSQESQECGGWFLNPDTKTVPKEC